MELEKSDFPELRTVGSDTLMCASLLSLLRAGETCKFVRGRLRGRFLHGWQAFDVLFCCCGSAFIFCRGLRAAQNSQFVATIPRVV